MNLILWRHAEAEDMNSRGDMARELTKRGRKHAQHMAHWLQAHLEGEWRIVVSPARRTLQTVAPLERPFEVSDALATGSYPEKLLCEAGWPQAGGNVLVVGHQPTLGEVAALLLRGEGGDVSIRKGAIWWFVTREREG
ncbi:MAG: histidine phosphatase family protein, partial [Usitatibacter sp.]